ncbi:MAG: hypothetical protein MHM6MM_001649 [Cercozoa sp. M6MM]
MSHVAAMVTAVELNDRTLQKSPLLRPAGPKVTKYEVSPLAQARTFKPSDSEVHIPELRLQPQTVVPPLQTSPKKGIQAPKVSEKESVTDRNPSSDLEAEGPE